MLPPPSLCDTLQRPQLLPPSPDISGQFARAFCPQRFSVFPTNQMPSGVPQRTIRAAIVASNRVCSLQRGANDVPATSCVPAKNHARTKRKNPRAPPRFVRCVRSIRWTIRGAKAISQGKRRAEGQGRRANPRQPLGHRQSIPQSPFPSPQKTWRVREKLGEFEKTREFSTTKTWRVRAKPDVFEKSGESRIKS